MQTQRRDVRTRVGGEGEGETHGERSRDAYTLTYVNRQSMGTFCMTRGTQTGLCNNLDRWEWAGSGREIQEEGDLCKPMVNSR